jgi:hypothetical protein
MEKVGETRCGIRAKLRNSTTVFLVGNIEPTMEWYKRLRFESEYYPPGFGILRRDEIELFLQQHPGYSHHFGEIVSSSGGRADADPFPVSHGLIRPGG